MSFACSATTTASIPIVIEGKKQKTGGGNFEVDVAKPNGLSCRLFRVLVP